MEFIVMFVYAWIALKDPEPHQIQAQKTEQVYSDPC